MRTATHKSTYEVGDGPVHLKVTIGAGQLGLSTVVANDRAFDPAPFFDHDIGLGNALRGTMLTIISIVTDTNPQSSRTSVTYELQGGPAKAAYHSEIEATNDDAIVMHVAYIELRG